ncbi:MAG: glycosyltransferase family 39 protein [Thermomicrobiales bacterium]
MTDASTAPSPSNTTLDPSLLKASTIRGHWWQDRRLWHGLIAVVLFAFSTGVYFNGNETTDFHQDESRWLNRAHYFADLLDPFGPTWEDQYLTRGQPPVGSYVMGIGLLLQGRDLDTNLAWDFRRGSAFNMDNGMFPSAGDMQAGRRTNNVLGALAVVAVFLIVTNLTNTFGGLAAALLLVANPLQSWHNRLALADTTLTVTLALLLLTLVHLMRRPRWSFAILVGVLVGLGGANKFTPLALAVPLAGLGFLMLVQSWWAGRKLNDPSMRGWKGLPPLRDVSWMLMSTPFVAGFVFVAVYPYLWPDPIGRALVLLRFRQQEMASQSRVYPDRNIANTTEAFHRTWDYLTGQWSGTQRFLDQQGLPSLGDTLAGLDVWLALAGIAFLAILAARKGLRSPHLMVLAIVVVESATVVLSMRTDFERYYLPIVLGNVVTAGVFAGVIGSLVWRLVPSRVRHTRRAQPSIWTSGRPVLKEQSGD